MWPLPNFKIDELVEFEGYAWFVRRRHFRWSKLSWTYDLAKAFSMESVERNWDLDTTQRSQPGPFGAVS